MRVRLPRSSSALVAVTGLVASGAAALVLAPAAQADSPDPVCGNDTCTVTYAYTGTAQSFTVPDRVAAVTVTASGAKGGGFYGGAGGQTTATVPVTAGDTLGVVAGQQGSDQDKSRKYGGGGAAQADASGGSGGGGSFVFAPAGSLLVAAGGGGGNQGGYISDRFGGAGSGAATGSQSGVGGSGGRESQFTSSLATGGTQSAGGQGGRVTWNGQVFPDGANGAGPASGGAPGQGGDGATGGPYGGAFNGGGGGGGYYGGGGGSGAEGGGGGSGYAAASAKDVDSAPGVNSGAGSVVISWVIPKAATTTTLSASPTPGNASDGDQVILTATVTSGTGTPSGTVAFTADETAVAGCAAVAVTDGAATCTTNFGAGKHSLDAAYSGSDQHKKSAGTLDYDVKTLPTISTDATLAAGAVGVAYSQQLTGTGGAGNDYTYSFPTPDTHPSWLSLSASGALTGTPDTAGSSTFAVTISDASRSTSTQFSVTVGKGSQAIDFTLAPTDPAVGGSYQITSVTPGGADTDVVFTGHDACSLDGTTVTFDRAGTCIVTANQAGDADYEDATPTSHEVTVGKATQTLLVTSNPPASGVVGGSHTLTVTGGKSTEAVSIGLSDSTTNSACSVGTVTTSVVDGTQRASAPISYDKVGTCAVAVTQGGDDDYAGAATSSVETEVAGKATTTSLQLSSGTVVHGQPVTATAAVTGGAAGQVYFYVDDKYYGSAEVEDGTATSGNLAATHELEPNGRVQVLGGAGKARGLTVGNHSVTAFFAPTDGDTYASSSTANGSPLTVEPAKTTTTVKVNAKTLVATVTVNAPSTDVPTGTVTFYVDGEPVGTADIVEGKATLDYTAPTGKSVAAAYNGREDATETVEVTGSSASTARKNPTVTATLSSSKAKSKAGWYSRPVTVRFTCTAGSDVVTSCPKPVTVTRDGMTTISRTVKAEDGGIATVTTTVKLDRTRPTVKVTGVRNGGTYPTLPKVGCGAGDRTSGIASCVLTRTVGGGTTTTFVATATDRAGNVSRSSVTVRRSPVIVTGADYSGSLPTVKRGKTYTLVYTGKGTPRYVYAGPSPVAPKGDGGKFTKIGKNRWAYAVTFTKSLKSHPVWTFGVKVGKKTIEVAVRVVK